jgi:hypothetical protein
MPVIDRRRAARLVAATMAAIPIGGCSLPRPGDAVGPSPVFEIRGERYLTVGAGTRLTAWYAERGNYDFVQVPVTWSTDSALIELGADGSVRAVQRGAATVRAAAGGHGIHMVSIEIVPEIPGVWRGTIAVASCRRVSGEGPDPCDARRGTSASLALEVTQRAAGSLANVNGAVELGFTPASSGWFQGSLDSRGGLTISGGLTSGLTGTWGFGAQLDESGSRMEPRAQTSEFSLRLQTGAGRQDLAETWVLSPLTRTEVRALAGS